jgi:2-methylcitrate dehydratase PrpD
MNRTEKAVYGLLPPGAVALFALARSKKAQGSLEYIMMVAAASIVIVLALAMIVKLRGAVVSNVTVNGSSMGVAAAIGKELGSLTSNGV